MTQLGVAVLVLALAAVFALICLTTDSVLAGALGIALALTAAYLAYTAPTQPTTTTITITIPEDTP